MNNMEHKIINSLLQLGISPSIKGFHYLINAITLYINSNMSISSFSGDIYPKLAEIYKTSSGSVERAVRHAINSGWSRHDPQFSSSIFGNSLCCESESPTNAVFISAVAEWIRLEMSNNSN